jgi:translocator protein
MNANTRPNSPADLGRNRSRPRRMQPRSSQPSAPQPGQASSWPGALAWVALTLGAALAGAGASAQAPTFYGLLQKPVWAPPAWLFGPVWSVLYALLALAAVLVYLRLPKQPQGRSGLLLFGLALVPNALWSWTFFYWHWGLASLAVIALLWAFLLATVLAFWRVQPASAWLVLPTLLWVSFAAALNAALVVMNPSVL